MLPIYVGSLALGGVLILASIVLGDTDTDAGTDLDAGGDLDINADADQDALLVLKDPGDAVSDVGIWLPFFSLRFWTFAAASFGGSGLLLHVLGVTGLLAALVSIFLGGLIGTGAAWVFRKLQLTESSGNVGLFDIQGAEATVMLSVGPDKPGKVRVVVDEQHIDLPARTQSGQLIERGHTALVLQIEDGVANITPVPTGYQSIAKED